MAAYYETAKSVEDVAAMLGRPAFGVRKKGASMGLRRLDLHDIAVERLKNVLDETPKSSGEIARLLGMSRNAACAVLRRASDEGVCHVADVRAAGGRGRDAFLWAAGLPDDSVVDCAIERAEREALRSEHAGKPFKAFRDPFIAALFGAAA